MDRSQQSQDDIAIWNQIAATYVGDASQGRDRIYQELKPALWDSLGAVQDLHILDLGCGDGWLSQDMAAAGARVVGVDGSSALLTVARTRAPTVTFLEANVVHGLPHTDFLFDRIVAYMVLMDLPELQHVIADVRRSLQPTGKLIFTLPHPCFFHYPIGRNETTGGRFKMISGYLEEEIWQVKNFGGHNHYHRPLAFYLNLLGTNHLAVTRLFEPYHLADPANPDREWYRTIPIFLLVEAIPV